MTLEIDLSNIYQINGCLPIISDSQLTKTLPLKQIQKEDSENIQLILLNTEISLIDNFANYNGLFFYFSYIYQKAEL